MNPIGSLPPHIANAYGVRPAQPPARPEVTKAAEQPQRVAGANDLVAGRAGQPIDFGGRLATPNADVLPLYTRAADKVEAAVSIQVGRQIDVTG